MNKMLKLSLIDVLKDFQYLVSVLIMLAISTNSFYQSSKLFESKFNMVYIYVIINIFVFVLLLGITITITTIKEKVSGRCEFYLANNNSISNLVKTFTFSTYVSTILPIVFIDIVFITMFIIKGYMNLELTQSMFGFQISFLIFSFTITSLIVRLVMVIKQPNIIRTVLTLSSMLVMYLLLVPVKFLLGQGSVPEASFTLQVYSMFLLFISLCFILSSRLFTKNLNKETVILSLKE